MEDMADELIHERLKASSLLEQMEAVVLPPLRNMLIKKIKSITEVGLLLALMKGIDVAQEKHPESFLSAEEIN